MKKLAGFIIGVLIISGIYLMVIVSVDDSQGFDALWIALGFGLITSLIILIVSRLTKYK